jgi:DNA-binding MarR family transcriptional regulator
MRSIAKTLAHFPDATEAIHVTRIDQGKGPEIQSDPVTASLLAQLGAHATARLTSRLVALELVPAHAGILRILTGKPGMSQCALAMALGTLPSRMVAYVDELERKGLLERRQHESDRRNNALYLTKAGRTAYRATSRLTQEHQQALLAGLSEQQRMQLAELLSLVATHQGLIPAAPFENGRPKEATQPHVPQAQSPVRPAPNVPAPVHPPSADDCSSTGTKQRT